MKLPSCVKIEFAFCSFVHTWKYMKNDEVDAGECLFFFFSEEGEEEEENNVPRRKKYENMSDSVCESKY